MNTTVGDVTITKKGGTKELQVMKYDDGAVVFLDALGNRVRADSNVDMQKLFEMLKGL